MEPPWEGVKKVYINGPGHMTKIAAVSIYGKSLKIFICITNSPMHPAGDVLWVFVEPGNVVP